MKSKSIIFAIAFAILLTGCYEDPRYTAAKNYQMANDKLVTCINNGSSCNDFVDAKNEALGNLGRIIASFNSKDPYNLY